MQNLAVIWLSLAACLAVIGVAGVRLSRYGDIIAEKSGMSRGWVGLIMLASVTSLPELVTGLSAVTVAEVPDIAVGNILGACIFNLLFIVVLDFFYRKESIYTRARQGNVLAAGFGIVLIGVAGFNLLPYGAGTIPSIGHVGLYTPVILLLYLLAMRTLYRYERAQVSEYVEDRGELYRDVTLKKAVQGYGGGGGRRLAALHRRRSGRRDGLAAEFRRHPVRRRGDDGAGDRGDDFRPAHGRRRSGHRQSVRQQPVQHRNPRDRRPRLPARSAVCRRFDRACRFGLFGHDDERAGGDRADPAPASRVFRTVSWISLLLLVVYLLNTPFLYLHGR